MNYCLGTVQFGMKYGIQENERPSRENVWNILSYAVCNGISVFDTASAYGESEVIIGEFIETYPEYAKNMKIVSKLRPDSFENEPVVRWKAIAESSAFESLSRLGIPKFEAYLFHNAKYIYDADAIEALSVVKEKGLANKVGVSVYTPDEAMKALDYSQVGAIQIPYNVFDRRLDKCGFFDRAISQDVTVYARSPLLQGLVMMDPDNLPNKVIFASEYLRKYLEICKSYNISPFNAAITYVNNRKGIDYIVFGVDNIAQLKEYIEMENQVLPDGMLDEFAFIFNDVEEKLVNPALWND